MVKLSVDQALLKAKSHTKKGEIEEAQKLYRALLQVFPNNKRAQQGLTALNKLQEPDNSQGPPQARINELINFYNQGQLIAVVDQASKLTEKYPEAFVVWNLLGAANEGLGRVDKAAEAFKKVTELNPNYADGFNNLGVTLQDQGKLEEAIDAYNKAIALKPNYADPHLNIIELLKIGSPLNAETNNLFFVDKKVKEIGSKILPSSSDKDIAFKVLDALGCIREQEFSFKTPLSQIYKTNSSDLNCSRHMRIFSSKNIIPKFCFACFKVQVEVDDLLSLIKLTRLFYDLKLDEDVTRKTMVEMRPESSGFYKGLIYCRGLNQAQEVKNLLDIELKNLFYDKIKSHIKRGCSEFPLKFPNVQFENKIISIEWQLLPSLIAMLFNKENTIPSISEFCLSDFYIIQKWIDYAKGLMTLLADGLMVNLSHTRDL